MRRKREPSWMLGGLAVLALASFWGGCAGPREAETPGRLERRPAPFAPRRQATRLLAVADVWMPFTGRRADRPGVATELVKLALEPQGYLVEYRELPWERCLAAVRAGRADLALCAVPSEAPELRIPREPLAFSRRGLFVLRGSSLHRKGWKAARPEDLQGVRLVVPLGYDLGPGWTEFADRIRGTERLLEVRGDDPTERQVAALERGRADAAVANIDVVDHHLRQTGRQGLLVLVAKIGKAPLYAAVSPVRSDAREIALRLDEGLRRLKATGQAQQVAVRYGLAQEALFDPGP